MYNNTDDKNKEGIIPTVIVIVKYVCNKRIYE